MDMDRLSSLPDEVICHILSFLPTKTSVQTSVLSKRWIILWTRVPFLGFDYDFRRADIITKILFQQHTHGLHTFRIILKNLDDCNEELFQSWIVNITARNIRNLEIAQGYRISGLKLPQRLFTCKTLVDLSLDCCGGIPTSGIYFPALKKLQLKNVGFESLSHLISGCPVLEELSIVGKILCHCCVSSPTLTWLELRLQNDDDDPRCGVNLDTPALEYLRLYSSVMGELSVGALDSLIEADIDLSCYKEDNFIYFHKVLAFVGKMYNVKLLTLSLEGMPLINGSVFSDSAIKFHNLTKLDLEAADLGFIAFFLENANNLQVLKFLILSKVDNEHGWMEPKQVPACLISHLQTVELCRCGSFENGFDVLRYILVNAKVLKQMKVPTPGRYDLDWHKKLETLNRVASGSQECELVFDRDWPSLYRLS